MTPDENDMPGELVDRDQWANWADLSEDELPGFLRHQKQPYYGPTRNLNWTTEDGSGPFFKAYGHTTRHPNRGVGYVFSEDDEYVAIDLDGCLKGNGDLEEWCPRPPWLTAEDWAEVSSSGKGLKTAVKGVSLPYWWRNQEFEDRDHVGVECEDGNRFFALTGDLWRDHGTTIPEVDQETFEAWLKDVCRTVTGTTPWERERPQRSSNGSQSDVELGIFDVISSRKCPPGEKVAHPFHSSSTNENFRVDDDEPTWRCYRHDVTGNAHHLLGMEAGVFKCGDWQTRRITSQEWTEAYDYGREHGYDGIPSKKPQLDPHEENARKLAELYDREKQREMEYWGEQYLEHMAEIEANQEPEPTTEPADVARADGGSDWETVRELYKSNENGSTSEADYRAAQMLNETYNPKAVGGSDVIYCYDADVGYYVDDGRNQIKQTLAANLQAEFTPKRKRAILNHVGSLNYVTRDDFGEPEDVVCVRNGVLDLSDPENPELLDHSPEYEFTWGLDAPYDPDATNPEFVEFLEESVNSEDIDKLQEYTGESLRHWKQPSKMAILLGPTNAGKGTFLHVIEDLFGSKNVAAESIGNLAKGGGHTHRLKGRPLNIANELSTKRVNHRDMVKKLAGDGDAVSADAKWVKRYEFVPKTNHLFAANEVPDVLGAGEAFYGRWLFVMFPNTIPPEEQTPNLDDKLVGSDEKRAGILNWLLEGYARSQSMGAEYTNEKPFVDKIAQWKSYATPLERFKETCIETGSDYSENLIAHRDLYEVYKTMCEDTNQETSVNQGEMVEELEKIACVGTTQPSTQKCERLEATIFNGTGRPRCLRGLRLTDRGEDYYETVKATTGRDTDSVLDGMETTEDDNWTETHTFESSWAGSQ